MTIPFVDAPPRRKITVLLAQPRGFCAGVVRAIEIVERALEKHGAPVYVRHEIVHNRHVVRSLQQKGAVFVDDVADVPEGGVTIFSAHGVARAVVQEAVDRGLPVLDATCPLVTKVHRHASRYAAAGREIVLIGHAGHPEVEGTMGQVDANVHLVQHEDDVQSLPFPQDTPLAYVTQTTLSVDDTRGIIAALEARFSDVVGPDVSDICYATQNRQVAVRELAARCDVVLVVGASNSSNSNRLREIAAQAGRVAHLVSDGGDVDPLWLRDASTVGVTAGASAPEVLVESVIDALHRIGDLDVSTLPGIVERIEFRLPAELVRL